MRIPEHAMTRPLRVVPNPVVAELVPYSPERLDLPVDLVLDANEALAPVEALREAFHAASRVSVNRYPGASAAEARIAELRGIAPERVLVTAGADDALDRAIRTVGAPGRQAILTRPSFSMLPRYARLAGADVLELDWWSGPWPVDEALRAASDATAVVTVVSPNNPTGAVISAEDLARLADALPHALVLLDHAYAEFADHDLTDQALERPNVVVFRTFSKAWGGAGLRLGYAVGDARVIAWMRSVGQPYSVSAPSVAALVALLDADPEPPPSRIATVRAERQQLASVVTDLGCEALPSEGNFVLVRPPDAARLHRGLAALGVGVRRFGAEPLTGWLRITVPGDSDAFGRLVDGLRTALAPDALLFDMDGVLADVSRSYRRAIVDTAASWGVTVTGDDITAAKAAGDATNDWELTRRLLAERGVEAPLDEVTRRFERLYQGDGTIAGLYRTEAPRLDRDALARLARRCRLGIVTGRPRADARRFLDDHGLSDLFSSVVTMEDAPSKPDPAPVRLAMERLGVRHAWMVGDTPDDLRAARAAGVLPVGVPAPGDDPEAARTTLLAAGAAFVLDTPDDLEEVL